jgi:site-specific DNA recombinase
VRAKPPQAAAIYTRISHDPTGERLGVQRQEEDCRAEARRRGWLVSAVYEDDDRSAYSLKKPRPQYQRMLRDIQLGLRDGVMIWRLDRLHRQPRELEEFIVVCDKHQVQLATVTGDVDLSTSQGRLLARAWGAFAAHESEVKGERLSRAFEDRARRGLRHYTGRNYGYTSRMAINPREAVVITEAAARILRGESMGSVCRDLNRRRIPTARNTIWHATSLRAILVSPRIAGMSTYHGEIVGKGQWKGVIPRAQSERLRALLGDPERRLNQQCIGRHLLTGVLRCGRCGAQLYSSRVHAQRGYRCLRRDDLKGCGRIGVLASTLEGFVVEQMFERLDSPALEEALRRAHMTDPQWRRAQAAVDSAQGRLERLASDYGAGQLSHAEWLAARSALAQRMNTARAAVLSDSAESMLTEFVGDSVRLRSTWVELSHSRQVAIVSALVRGIFVWPAPTTHRRSPGERLTIWWQYERRPRAPRGAISNGTAERRAAGRFERCVVDGCSGPYHGGGYCQMHWHRVRRSGQPGSPLRLIALPYQGALCQHVGCENRAYSRDRCRYHYDQWRQTDPSRPRCAVAGCENAQFGRGWCNRHYLRWRKSPRSASQSASR